MQKKLYENSIAVIERKKHILYYDCTNFYFETEGEDDFRKYGISKEHRPNPIVQMGLFMDADGIPLAFSMFLCNQNEQPSLTPLEKKSYQISVLINLLYVLTPASRLQQTGDSMIQKNVSLPQYSQLKS